MKHSKHGNHLHQLTKFLFFNNFLVEEEETLTLIDTNFGNNTEKILVVAQQIGKPITRLVITHAHADHAGAIDPLVQAVPNVELLMSERTARLLSGDKSLDPGEKSLKGGFVTANANPTRTVANGDKIGSLEVIDAPGHSPDHIALMDSRDRTLIAGDAYVSQAGLAVSGVIRWLFPFPAMATWDKQIALTTARHLADLNPIRLVVGHGPVIESPSARMKTAIAEAEKKFGFGE